MILAAERQVDWPLLRSEQTSAGASGYSRHQGDAIKGQGRPWAHGVSVGRCAHTWPTAQSLWGRGQKPARSTSCRWKTLCPKPHSLSGAECGTRASGPASHRRRLTAGALWSVCRAICRRSPRPEVLPTLSPFSPAHLHLNVTFQRP